MSDKVTVDFSKNPKQQEFINTVIGAIAGLNDYRYFAYGGAIRGGKTFAIFATLVILCKKYPNSRWIVVRSDFTKLEKTTIPTAEKIIGNSANWEWSRNKGNYHVTYVPNNSKIFFYGENIKNDPTLDGFLGVECNGFFLEQIEELTEKMWEKAIERSGSHYTEPMPPAFIFSSFNPTQKWPKKKFYEPYHAGKLESPFFYLPALPSDNAFVTKDQWQGWDMMADRYKRQFIQGDWTNFESEDNLWCFAFDRDKHVSKTTIEPTKAHELYLSFDFNRNPITCTVIQHYDGCIRVIECIKLRNSNIYELCVYILSKYPNFLYIITGDATGKGSTALVQDNLNYYRVIAQKLNLTDGQIKVPSVNPRIEDNQVLVNSVMQHYPVQISATGCDGLIFDLENVRLNADGKIDKANRQDETQQADALDTWRYYLNTFFGWFLKTL
jgi:hypothetical protein